MINRVFRAYFSLVETCKGILKKLPLYVGLE